MSYCSKQTSINLFSHDKLFLFFLLGISNLSHSFETNALVIFSNKTKDHKIKLKRSNVIS